MKVAILILFCNRQGKVRKHRKELHGYTFEEAANRLEDLGPSQATIERFAKHGYTLSNWHPIENL